MQITKTPTTHSINNLAALAVSLLLLGLPACGNIDASGGTDNDVTLSAGQALTIGPVGHHLDYFQCATEGGTCALGGTKYVAFGANGSFFFKSVSGNVACTRDTFGGDPISGVVKACFFANYSFVMSEGGTSSKISHEIAYGVDGVFNFKKVSGTWTCNNATFGDPLAGPTKACYEAVFEDIQVALEGQNITSLSNTPVAYGASGTFIFKIASGTLACTTAAFGGTDPASGVQKTCYKFPYNRFADENTTFPVTRASAVYYGSGLNGNFLSKVVAPQHGFPCNNATFGGDPDVGPSKHCYVAAQ
jgi:hypothetical protein